MSLIVTRWLPSAPKTTWFMFIGLCQTFYLFLQPLNVSSSFHSAFTNLVMWPPPHQSPWSQGCHMLIGLLFGNIIILGARGTLISFKTHSLQAVSEVGGPSHGELPGCWPSSSLFLYLLFCEPGPLPRLTWSSIQQLQFTLPPAPESTLFTYDFYTYMIYISKLPFSFR